jgi:hypothetical protein
MRYDKEQVKEYASSLNLTNNGIIAIVSGSDSFKVGDKVKTRSDMGSLNFEIVAIHNDQYCTCKGYGKLRHFNMGYLEHYR